MKKETMLNVLFGTTLVTTVFMELGWSFFSMTVRCKKKGRNGKPGKDPSKKNGIQFSRMKKNHPRNGFEEEYESGKLWCGEQPMQDWYMKSEDGLILHARLFRAENAKRNVILCHGYRGSAFGDFAIVTKFLHEHACNLLLIDERCCGESEGEYITFGAMEKRDIRDWTRMLVKRLGKEGRLPTYLYGMSMGAASVLMAGGYRLPRSVKGIIADCGFRSMRGELEDLARYWFHVKWIKLLLFRCEVFCKVCGKFSMRDADTTAALKRNTRPVLFFHGQEDGFVYPENSLHNYSICEAPKELVLIPGARHICSIYKEPEMYKEKLLEFFSKVEKKASCQ